MTAKIAPCSSCGCPRASSNGIPAGNHLPGCMALHKGSERLAWLRRNGSGWVDAYSLRRVTSVPHGHRSGEDDKCPGDTA